MADVERGEIADQIGVQLLLERWQIREVAPGRRTIVRLCLGFGEPLG